MSNTHTVLVVGGKRFFCTFFPCSAVAVITHSVLLVLNVLCRLRLDSWLIGTENHLRLDKSIVL